MYVTEHELVFEIEKAAGMAFQQLFSNNENYYYCSLITTGEALSPFIVAWSHEALERYLSENNCDESDIGFIKWSYADSPYLDFGGEYFSRVKELFLQRPEINYSTSEKEWGKEFELRLNSMEKAMANLDKKGLFGRGNIRNGVVINVEVIPPDYGNTLRAIRLNPEESLLEWLEEVAEQEE